MAASWSSFQSQEQMARPHRCHTISSREHQRPSHGKGSSSQASPGSNVILSRSDPAVNPVMSNGRVFTPGNKFGLLSGSVYSATRKYVRVYFDVDVADILHGQWR